MIRFWCRLLYDYITRKFEDAPNSIRIVSEKTRGNGCVGQVTTWFEKILNAAVSFVGPLSSAGTLGLAEELQI